METRTIPKELMDKLQRAFPIFEGEKPESPQTAINYLQRESESLIALKYGKEEGEEYDLELTQELLRQRTAQDLIRELKKCCN